MARANLPARADHYEFTRSLQRLVESLPPSPRVLRYLCDRLDSVLDAELGDRLAGTPVDLSTTWRREIETDQRGHEYDPKSAMVTAVLRMGARWAEAGRDIGELIQITAGHPRWLFRRIELELARKGGGPELKRALLLNEDLFRLSSARREYLALVRDGCGILNRDDVLQLMRMVESGDMDRFQKTYEDMMGQGPSEAEVTRHQQGWRLMWLSAMKDCLDTELKAELAQLEEVFSAAVTPPAPAQGLSDDEIQTLDAAALLRLVSQRSGAGGTPADELARQLTEMAAASPEFFTVIGPEALAELDPTFVHSLLSGLEQAVRQSRAVPWAAGMHLIKRAVADGPIPERRGSAIDYDPDWTSAKCAAASLLSAAFTTAGIPGDVEDSAREAIASLAHDQSPVTEEEQAVGPLDMRYATAALNTVRPRAVAAAIDLALWHKNAAGPQEEEIDRSVAELLEERLANDHAPAVRSVFGSRLTSLTIVDAAWVERHLSTILGRRLSDSGLGRIAWADFVRFNQPHVQLFDLLASYYEEAVDIVASEEWDESFVSMLAYHLAALYMWGRLTVESDGLMDRFFARASVAGRTHLLDVLGEILAVNAEPPPEVADRLRRIWEWREQEVEAGRGDREELGSFGSWFGSGRLADDWSLAHLQTAIRHVLPIPSAPEVADQLARLAPSRPADVIATIELVLRGDPRGWIIHSWDEVIRTAVSKARGGTPQTRQVADEFVSRLLTAGYVQYSDLVE
jgi:hypothetical protein